MKKYLIRNKFFYALLLTFFFAFGESNAAGLLIKADALCKLWYTGSTYKVMHNDPVPEIKGKIILQSAKNEFESFQLVLSPNADMENISVVVNGFANKSGLTIPAENISVRKVEYVHITKPSGIRHKAGWYPDPLPLLEKPFSVKAGVHTPILISVKVPKNATPGVYSAQVSLKSAAWETVFPVELKVWDFTLPDMPNMRSAFGLYSNHISAYHNLSNNEELKQVLDLYYQSFRDYRISPQQFFDQYPIEKTVKGVWWQGGTFDPDTVFAGKYSYQVNGNHPGTPPDLIEVNPEKPYWVKWQVKTLSEGQEYLVTVKSYTSDKKVIPWQLQGMFYTGSTRWRKDSLFLDPINPFVYEDMVLSRPMPKNTRYASVQIFSVKPDDSGRKSGTAWFDNVQFVDAATGKNLLPKGDFEQNINDLGLEIDFSEFDLAARKYLDEFGFTGFRVKIPELRPGPFINRKTGWFAGFVNGTAEYEKLITLYLKGFQDHLEANGWLGKEYLYWIDEPKHEDYGFVREGMETIHKAAPKLTRLITENNPGPEIMDVTEIGCPVLAKFDPEKSKEWIANGRQMWSYLMTWPKAPHVNLFIDSDAINLRMWLWMSYRYRLTGILVWSSNVWNTKSCSPPGVLQNIWDDPMTYMSGSLTTPGAAAEYGNGDGMFFYPPNRDPDNDKTKYLTGPVPSLRLEIMREGIDDYDYMMLLEDCIRNARPDQQNLVKRAMQVLNFGSEVFVTEKEYTKNPEILAKYRQQMGNLLEQFKTKK